MKPSSVEFWLLLILAATSCLIPMWPNMVACWLLAAMVWERKYGLQCWIEQEPETKTIYIGEAAILSPLILTHALGVAIAKFGGNHE